MDFDWSEEEKLFRESVRDFAQKEIAPIAEELDANSMCHPDMRDKMRRVLKGMADLGLLGITIPDKYGGAGVDKPFTFACIGAEELAKADISIALPVFYLVEASWAILLAKYGTEEAKEEILPQVAKGEMFFGIATTEPGGGSDLSGAVTTQAEQVGDKWKINGEKVYISGIRESRELLPAGGTYFLLARTGNERPSHRNMSAFCLPLKKDSPGIEPTLFEDMGRMGVSTGGFKMTDVEIPKHYLIGQENKGFYHAMEGFSNARVIIGATCLGAAEAGINIGIDYIKQRKAFGRPIGAFEGIQFELADNYCSLEADKLLTYKAAWLTDKLNTDGSANHFEVAMASAIAKLRAPQDAVKILWDAQTWHGAFGYTKECALERGVRGVRSYTVGAEGTMNIMKTVIARELLGNEYLPYRQPPQY